MPTLQGLNLIPVFIIRKGKEYFNIAGSQTKGLSERWRRGVISADGFLGVNALSGGCRERVTPCSGVSGVKRLDRVKGRAIAGS